MINDANLAEEVARRFLEQYHSTLIIKEVVLQDDTWLVTMNTGFETQKLKKVKVDGKSGKILECVSIC